jgi:hypothetical protein
MVSDEPIGAAHLERLQQLGVEVLRADIAYGVRSRAAWRLDLDAYSKAVAFSICSVQLLRSTLVQVGGTTSRTAYGVGACNICSAAR